MVTAERIKQYGGEQVLQYNVAFDQGEKDSGFIRTQLETHLKERFNTLLSKVEYEIVDGHLVRLGTTEPFINSITRGRDLLRRLSKNPIDFAREDAEVAGFGETIDPVMSNPNASLGIKILSISPKGGEGSKYEHNFYDIFVLREKNNKRYVELLRYSSALLLKEYAQILGLSSDNPSDADLLAHPIIIDNLSVTAEQIHQRLHKEHGYMSSLEFDEIWQAVQSYVDEYLVRRDARSFNAILNFADEVWENLKRKKNGLSYIDYMDNKPSYGERRYYEEKEVRQVSGGCPGKSGADIDDSPFSVSEFDFGYKFDKPGPCKNCGADVNCGPCGLCRSCDIEIRIKNKQVLRIN